MTGSNGSFVRRKQLKNLSVPLTGKGTTLVLDALLFEQDLILFSEAEELSLAVDWKCSDMGNIIVSTVCKSFAMWHSSCRVAFNRMPRN